MKYIKLFENFNIINNIDTQLWYHGNDNKLSDFSQSIDYLSRDANEEEGPGIYLTTDPTDAAKYGKFVHNVKIITKNELISQDDIKVKQHDIKIAEKLIKKYKNEWELDAQNYSENPNAGLAKFLRVTKDDAKNRVDFWQYIWHEFFRYDPKSFVRGMNAIGIDGIIVKGYHGHGTATHAIMYNMDAMQIVNVSE